jgi:8-oxo-dGTP pyrophosphatase MutT (NUDIX family)
MLQLTQSMIQEYIKAYEVDHTQRYGDLFSTETLDHYRRAAVLIPMLEIECEWYVLLTQRSHALVEHKGQVAYPGGARESQDIDLCHTALREMWEEIGVKPEDVHVFGHLGDMPVVTGYLVRPYVGQIPWPYTLEISNDEVHSVFKIPLHWLANPHNRTLQFRSYAGREFPVIFFDPYDGYQLWGASAEMTLALLSALGLADKGAHK